jgi:hypothetical protein
VNLFAKDLRSNPIENDFNAFAGDHDSILASLRDMDGDAAGAAYAAARRGP